MPFAVCVTFTLHPSQRETFLPLMLTNARTSLETEEGCHQFDVLTDPDRPEEVFLYEIYSDAAAFQSHLDSAHFHSFDQAVGHMIAEKVVKTYKDVTA